MGFSVSGSAAILFLGMVISFGVAYSAAFNGFENVSDAYKDDADRILDQKNTAINMTNVSWNQTATDQLTVKIDNTGATTLSVNDTDLLVDNNYQTSFVNRSVVENPESGLWMPGETLNMTITNASKPGQIKVVTGPGVSATGAV